MARSKFGRGLITLVFLGGLAALAYLGTSSFRAGPPPEISLEPQLPAIGKSTPIKITVAEGTRGLSKVRIEFGQGEARKTVDERVYTPREPYEFWGDMTERDEFIVEVGKEMFNGLREGEATIRVVAERAPSWLRSPEASVKELTLPVRLRPPSLEVTSTRTYVTQGGSEMVIYRVGKTSIEDGVQAGDWWFPGFQLPGGGEQDRFALFSVPYDMEDISGIVLVARDDVENEARQPFIDRFKLRPFGRDTIRLSDSFMGRVIPAILDQTPELTEKETLLATYLMINGELRARNTQELIELSRSSVEEFLWRGTFVRMRNAQLMSEFADRRTYTYNGEAVDTQDHLGFDLASTERADIEAANSGIVVLAKYFGIYGNAVVIDHGYGLTSLYGHLSAITVEQGQRVERGQVVGRSGKTGLAGGDHLHFTMLLQGLPINPREWWDSHWIQDRLKLKLGSALPD